MSPELKAILEKRTPAVHTYTLTDLSGSVSRCTINLTKVNMIEQHRGRGGPVVEIYFTGSDTPKVLPYEETEYNALCNALMAEVKRETDKV